MTDNYAYGDWCIEGKSCPIESAGLKPFEGSTDLAESYDSEVIAMMEDPPHEGVVDKEIAKEAFVSLYRRFNTAAKVEEDMYAYYKQMKDIAAQILEEEFDVDVNTL